jgi:FAD/FMN-containing dehydrogenase
MGQSRMRQHMFEAQVSDATMLGTFASLRSLPAAIIEPDHPDYDDARALYNRVHDLYPLAIVRPLRLDDVAVCLGVMKASGCRVAIRGGGHHIAGFGSCDAGLVLDLSGHRDMRYDAVTGVAEVEAGARLADVDRALSVLGRIVPLGTVSDTGVAGLTLSGGIGWLVGMFGLTCDNLVGADVALADGTTVRAEDRPDLLWALRGGGGNFGVVLRFRFRTYPLPKFTVGSALVPIEHAGEALRRAFAFLRADCPPELTVAPMLTWRERPVMSIDFCHAQDSAAGSSYTIDRFRDAVCLGNWQEHVDADFVAWQSAFDANFLPPMRGYWRSAYYYDLADSALDVLIDHFAKSGCPNRSVLIEHLHGAFHAPSLPGAFAMRGMRFGVLWSARWPMREADEENIAWVRDAFDRIQSHTGTQPISYANYAFASDHDVRVRSATDFALLRKIKTYYDPDNFFARNHNIPPEDKQPASAGTHFEDCC